MARIATALRRHVPCAAAAVAWAAEILTALFDKGMHGPLHELVGVTTVCCTCWALMCRIERRRKPEGDGRWITIEELAGMEAAMLSGLLAGQGEPPQEPARILHSA